MDEKPLKKGLVEKLAHRYINDVAKKNIYPSDEPHLLNEHEKKVIQKTQFKTLFLSAFIGMLGVLFLYLPQYFFPALFPVSGINISGTEYSFELVSSIYGIALIWPELWALNYINVKAVREISRACVYPRPNTPDFDFHVNALTDAGLEKEHKGIKQFGLNPYLNMSKGLLWLILIVNRIKATLSNIVAKLIIKRVLGRYAVRQITDLAGIPIFAFWNAWASARVIAEAKFRIMAPMALQNVLTQLKETNLDLSVYLFPALQFAIAQKRKYNYAQYYWVNMLHQNFRFDDTRGYSFEAFNNKLKTASPEIKEAVSKIIVCAIVVDGKLSNREKNAVKKLYAEGWFLYDLNQIASISRSFNQGNGLMV